MCTVIFLFNSSKHWAWYYIYSCSIFSEFKRSVADNSVQSQLLSLCHHPSYTSFLKPFNLLPLCFDVCSFLLYILLSHTLHKTIYSAFKCYLTQLTSMKFFPSLWGRLKWPFFIWTYLLHLVKFSLKQLSYCFLIINYIGLFPLDNNTCLCLLLA